MLTKPLCNWYDRWLKVFKTSPSTRTVNPKYTGQLANLTGGAKETLTVTKVKAARYSLTMWGSGCLESQLVTATV